MTYEEAVEHLKSCDCITEGGLYNIDWYLSWNKRWPKEITLDGDFTVKDLEAICVYIKGE